jgi:hypothetical protein
MEKLGGRPLYFSASLISISRFSTSVKSSESWMPRSSALPEKYVDGGGHQHPGAGRDVVETASPFAEIDLGRHVVVFDWLIAHKPS